MPGPPSLLQRTAPPLHPAPVTSTKCTWVTNTMYCSGLHLCTAQVAVLDAELEAVPLAKALQYGLPREWVTRLEALDRERRQVGFFPLRFSLLLLTCHAMFLLSCLLRSSSERRQVAFLFLFPFPLSPACLLTSSCPASHPPTQFTD